MENRKRIALSAVAVIMSFVFLAACGKENSKAENAPENVAEVASATTVPFLRMDRDDPDEWNDELDNVRIITGNLYKFGKVSDKYGIDPDYVPDTKGLDSLNISGSAQFSAPQFKELANTLKECAEGKTIYIIDLRQESHGLINEGMPVSWYDSHNWANAGMTLEEVEADEKSRFGEMVGKTVKAYARDDDSPVDETVITIDKFYTEEELVESEGCEYLRLPLQDHVWPAAEDIDQFIAFAKDKDTDKVWLHFHCQAGKGRTGIMMTIYDMMNNPDVYMEDIVIRQTKLGGSYPLYTEESDDYKAPLYKEKAMMMPLIYQYIQEQCELNYETSWSEWLKKHQ